MRTHLRGTAARRTSHLLGLGLAATGMVAVVLAPAAGAAPAAAPAPVVTSGVHVFPSPGTSTISPSQQFSFRGVATSALPTLQVTGSSSGAHAGRWVVQSDNGGATWEPATKFSAGEKLTLSTSATVSGTSGHSFSYTVARPAAISPQKLDALLNAGATPAATPNAARAATAQPATTAPAPIVDNTPTVTPPSVPPTYLTRPDLHPPAVTAGPVAGYTPDPGLILSTPMPLFGAMPAGTQTGNEISDNNGKVVWFNPVPNWSFDLHPITYLGQSALVYHQSPCPACYTQGSWVVLDTHYNQIATISADNGYTADGHALEISPDGRNALLLIANPIMVADPNGGPPQPVLEGVIQQIDLATGAMDFEWHSLGLDNTGAQFVPQSDNLLGGSPSDYIHLNSANYVNGNTIIFSARHTSTVYKLDIGTDPTDPNAGQILWRLGGIDPRNQFKIAGDDGPSFAHDAQVVLADRESGVVTQVSVYDNGYLRNPQYGRGVLFDLTESGLTATVDKQWTHNPPLFGFIVGSNRTVGNGDQMVSYGNTGYADEYDASGNVVWNSQLESNGSGTSTNQVFSYRILRAENWHATPQAPPDVVVQRTSPTSVTVTGSWNGATDVTGWQLYAGPTAGKLRSVGNATSAGFETPVTGAVNPDDTVFQLRALRSNNMPTGISHTTGDAIAVHYQSLGGASSFLGAPKAGGEQVVGPGLVQAYANGNIYWSAATGAFEVGGAILGQYLNVGGPTGFLGFPKADEAAANPGGRVSTFQYGNIYWTPASGAAEVHGAIGGLYLALGGPAGVLGFPTANEAAANPGGRVSTFQGGNIYWSPATGAASVQGAIGGRYVALGGPAFLGFPTANEAPANPGGRVSTFQYGNIYWTPATGAFEVHGAIGGRYLAIGGPRSFIGFPTSNEFTPAPGLRQNNFQFGHSIVYNLANGSITVR